MKAIDEELSGDTFIYVVFFYIEILHLEYFISKLVLTRSETLAL